MREIKASQITELVENHDRSMLCTYDDIKTSFKESRKQNNAVGKRGKPL